MRDHLVVSIHHVEGTKCLAADIVEVDVADGLPWRTQTIEPDEPPAVALRLFEPNETIPDPAPLMDGAGAMPGGASASMRSRATTGSR